MTSIIIRAAAVFALSLIAADIAAAQPAPPIPAAPAAQPAPAADELRIEWEVKNRFRLFRSERDFQRQLAAYQGDGVLGAEFRLAEETDGRGWAREVVERLCTDRAGTLTETCDRDGVKENYLSPNDYRVGVVLAGAAPQGARCLWNFDDGASPAQQVETPCEEEVRLRAGANRRTVATLNVMVNGQLLQSIAADIQVNDMLIAGLGDSIAAGEGNPDRAVQLSDGGFCFRRFGTGTEYWRPGREAFRGAKACGAGATDATAAAEWARHGARWMSGPCHRSLYGYQMRTALTLAIENPHRAVTFIPLACTGATIEAGLLAAQRARECATPAQPASCNRNVRGQLEALRAALAAARRTQPDRNLDLILLTIGANDIAFSGLVADVIVDSTAERLLFKQGGVIASAEDAESVLATELPAAFAKLRTALKPLVGGDLARVVYVSYGHPALAGPNTPCPGGRDGFDVHPAFNADPQRLARVADFVSRRFLPRIKALATCEAGTICRDASERMTFVDSHQADFAAHGFCARGERDPDFDRACFSAKGESFRSDPADAATDPMACGESAGEFRPYASRKRWVRTANDSYFTAMTYPDALSSAMKPADIHDATWAVLASVYGGAIHPTAEGHAAMADAALPAARAVLGLDQPPAVQAAPLPPPTTGGGAQ